MKYRVKIDCTNNGALVTISNYKGVLHTKVFEGKDYVTRYNEWIKEKTNAVDKMNKEIYHK